MSRAAGKGGLPTVDLNSFICGDCMDYLPQFPDNFFDLAIVDPPYFSGPERREYYGRKISPIGVQRHYEPSENWEVPGLEYFRELQIYIAAGEEKLKELQETTLPQLHAEAAAKGDAMSAQVVRDFEDTVNRFEKKIHDLKLSKTVAIQTAPQIRLIQNNDKMLVDKIQTAILSTIPLWKSQIVIALGLHRQESVLKMQRSVSDATNTLLTKNAELLRQNSTEVAKESERSIVDLETLKKVNADLISTIEETIKIQQEGRAARQGAEAELLGIEQQLKQALLTAM